MEQKYIPCEIKFKILNDEVADFNKFIATKDMKKIFYLDEKFKNSKIKLNDEEFYYFRIEYELIKFTDLVANVFCKDFSEFIVVEPYVEDCNGKFLADYKNFCVIHAQIANIHILKLPTYPVGQPNGLSDFDKYKFWAEINSYGMYRLHYSAATMELEMRGFCFKSIEINNFRYKDSYIAEMEELKLKKEKELYLQLKNKFEPS